MIATTICTFTWELTIINVGVRILLTTFPTHFTSSTIILMVAIFLACVTLQWVVYVLLDPLHCIASFYFFGYFGVLNCLIYIFVSIDFPSFLINTLLTSVTPCFFRSLFISLMVHKEILYFSQVLYLHICPTSVRRNHWGYGIQIFPSL